MIFLTGVQLKDGGRLRIESNCVNVELPEELPDSKADNRILRVCKALCDSGENVILVTKDIVLRVKASMIDIPAEDFESEQVVRGEHQYTGRIECFAPEEEFRYFSKKGMAKDVLYLVDEEGQRRQPELYENQFVIIKADQSRKKTQLGRIEGNKVVPLEFKKAKPYGVEPKRRAVFSAGSVDDAQ